MNDDFGDGDFTRNPSWTVTAGKYWVENGRGLRSAVKAEAAAPQQRQLSGKEAVGAIFGQILQQALDPEGRSSGGQAGGGTSGTVINPTATQTRLTMTNAFAMEVEFSSWAAQGRLEIGPYQGVPAAATGPRAIPWPTRRAAGWNCCGCPSAGPPPLTVPRYR